MNDNSRPLLSLGAEMVSTNDATIAVVKAFVAGEHFEWTGTSKRFPGDKGAKADRNNPAVGQKLALARALRAAAAQLERQANGLTKNIDDNRRQSEAARKRQVPKAFRVRARNTRNRKAQSA
jgi:hypothetical protein